MDKVFKALNDPTRRKILDLLRAKDLNAGEIAEQFNISKPSISHHLDLLKQADLIVSEKQGQFITYSINTTVLDECLSWLMDLARKKKGKKHESRKSEKGMVAAPHTGGALLRRRPALG